MQIFAHYDIDQNLAPIMLVWYMISLFSSWNYDFFVW